MGMPANRPLQQVSVSNIGAFVAALVERREKVFEKRIDIAGDELTGEETANILSKASGRDITYEGFDPEFIRKDNADFADMYEWFNKVGYTAEGHAMDHEKIKEHMEKKKQVHQEIVEKLDKIIEMLESK